MSHKEQRDYVRKVRTLKPDFFKSQNIKVLDIGSLDINGSCRRFFSSQYYIGCDIGKGRGVDIVSPAHLLTFRDGFFDCVISCEAFEHDRYLPSTLNNAIRMLRSGGLFVFTCATEGREEHGTLDKSPESSPHTQEYYRNVTINMVKSYIEIKKIFSEDNFEVIGSDLNFYGIKV
jgi:SAM-dependent methyltransferase